MANKKPLTTKSKEIQAPIDPAYSPAEQHLKANPIELKTIEIRLDGVKEATKRSRFAFIVMTVMAAAILITIWNASLSWDSGIASDKQASAIISDKGTPVTSSEKETTSIAADEKAPAEAVEKESPAVAAVGKETPVIASEKAVDSDKQAPANDPLRQTIVTEWMRNQLISIGLLGVRVSGTDLSVIGSAGLIVIMTWYFYSQRRENRAIVKLLRHCIKEYKAQEIGLDVCSMIFHGIIDSTVFLDVIKGDVPVRGLEDEDAQKRKTFLIRGVLKVLVYLPPVTIILIICSDTWSLYQPSPIRPGGYSLWHNLRHDERVKATIFELVALLSAIYTGFLCWRSTRFSKATTDTLKDYMVFLKNSENLEKLSKKHK